MIRDSIHNLAELIQKREISVVELLDQYLQRIREHDSHYRTMAMMSEESVRILANKADRELASGTPIGPLHGIPILIDDLIDVANTRTSYGSSAFSEHVPDHDSMAVRRLRAAGAIIMGKTRTSELGALVVETEDEFVSRSPWSDGLVSGGGSSGLAVAQAMNFAAAGLGMDVGGNVMLPAAFSGVFAMRPSRGRIAHTPAFSRGLEFPDVSVVTSEVRDCAALLDVLYGYSDADPVSKRYQSQDVVSAMERPIRSLRIAHANSLWNAPYDDDCQSVVADAVSRLLAAGCRVERSRPSVANVINHWETIFSANLFADHGEAFRQHPQHFGEVASDWLRRGETISASDYIAAQKKILGFRLLLESYFEERDVLITAAVGCVPFAYGDTPSNLNKGSEMESRPYDYASMCMAGALSGFPTGILPGIVNDQELPVALLVMSSPGNDDLVLAISAELMRNP